MRDDAFPASQDRVRFIAARGLAVLFGFSTVGLLVPTVMELMGQQVVPEATTSLTPINAATVPGVDATLAPPIDPANLSTLQAATIAVAVVTVLLAILTFVTYVRMKTATTVQFELTDDSSVEGDESLSVKEGGGVVIKNFESEDESSVKEGGGVVSKNDSRGRRLSGNSNSSESRGPSPTGVYI